MMLPTATPVATTPTAVDAFPLPTVLVTTGAVVAAGGVVAAVAGSLPYIGYEQAAAELDRLDGVVGKSASKLQENAGAIKDARTALEENGAAWNSYGALTVIAGSTALVVGGAVAASAFLVE